MPTRSADNMVASLMIDIWPRNAAVVDFGLTEANYAAYQRAVRSGKLTADALHEHVYDSKWLSAQIGAPVNTGLDILLTADFDEGEESEDDPEPEDIDPVNYYDDGIDDVNPFADLPTNEELIEIIKKDLPGARSMTDDEIKLYLFSFYRP